MSKTVTDLLREIYDDVIQGAIPNPDDPWFEGARAALAAPAQAVPASVIMASVMRDDGGEHPAFCLMVAYRAEKDAKAALAMLTDEPAQQAAPVPASHPYAYEFSRSNEDGAHSLHIERNELQEGVLRWWERIGPPKGAITDRPIKALYETPQAHPVAAPEPHYGNGRYLGFARHNDAYSVAQVQALFAAAPSETSEYPPLVCDYCGALTPDPWHSSGMLHGKMSKHIHSCDACAARGATQASPVDANVQAAVPADLMTFTSSTQPALQQAHHEEQPDGTTIPIDPSEMAPQQPAPAPMSPANRLVAYSAATRLRELGFEWDATAEAWLQPAPSAQAADSVLEDAARYRWLREGNDAKHGAAWYVAVNLYGCEWDAAIDAAMNKGGAT